MKIYQAWISLGILAIAVIIISNITHATLADRYASPEQVDINWQEEIMPNGKEAIRPIERTQNSYSSTPSSSSVSSYSTSTVESIPDESEVTANDQQPAESTEPLEQDHEQS